MEMGLERDLRPFSGTARLTAASQLEGQDRCAAVESELKRLFAKASPLVKAQRPAQQSWEIDRPTERLPKLLVRPASSPARPRPSRTEEGFEGKPTRPWTQNEENRQLRRELRRLGGLEVTGPHFTSVAAENHWLRREATAKLLKAFLSDGASAASTRLPTPSNSTASNSDTFVGRGST